MSVSINVSVQFSDKEFNSVEISLETKILAALLDLVLLLLFPGVDSLVLLYKVSTPYFK